ncbi:hypothetical protein KCU93_g8878, partial [Aureobasidium melanogenum]
MAPKAAISVRAKATDKPIKMRLGTFKGNDHTANGQLAALRVVGLEETLSLPADAAIAAVEEESNAVVKELGAVSRILRQQEDETSEPTPRIQPKALPVSHSLFTRDLGVDAFDPQNEEPTSSWISNSSLLAEKTAYKSPPGSFHTWKHKFKTFFLHQLEFWYFAPTSTLGKLSADEQGFVISPSSTEDHKDDRLLS